MQKEGMIRVKAWSNGKEIFDCVKVSSLQRLIDEEYVVALWEDIVPDIRQRKEKG